MKIATKLASAFLAAAALIAPNLSNATLVFTITRYSDSNALVTGAGILDLSMGFSPLDFLGASATIGDPGKDARTGSMLIGSTPIGDVFVRDGEDDFAMDMLGVLDAGTAPTGTLDVTLDIESWAAIGTTGNIVGFMGVVLGTYSIVAPSPGAVPEPGTFALLGLGLVGLSATRRLQSFRR